MPRRVRENIYKIAAYDPEPPRMDHPRRSRWRRGVPATIWSDWHYGEVVRMPGINTYDKGVARGASSTLPRPPSTSPSTTWVEPRSPIPAALWLLGATCLGGDIHEELTKTNDRTTQQAIEDLIDLIAAASK
jgi:hypothetical protein